MHRCSSIVYFLLLFPLLSYGQIDSKIPSYKNAYIYTIKDTKEILSGILLSIGAIPLWGNEGKVLKLIKLNPHLDINHFKKGDQLLILKRYLNFKCNVIIKNDEIVQIKSYLTTEKDFKTFVLRNKKCAKNIHPRYMRIGSISKPSISPVSQPLKKIKEKKEIVIQKPTTLEDNNDEDLLLSSETSQDNPLEVRDIQEKDINESIKKNPKEAQSHAVAARFYLSDSEEKNLDKALEEIRLAQKLDSSEISFKIEEIKILDQLDQHDEAKTKAKTLIKDYPQLKSVSSIAQYSKQKRKKVLIAPNETLPRYNPKIHHYSNLKISITKKSNQSTPTALKLAQSETKLFLTPLKPRFLVRKKYSLQIPLASKTGSSVIYNDNILNYYKGGIRRRFNHSIEIENPKTCQNLLLIAPDKSSENYLLCVEVHDNELQALGLNTDSFFYRSKMGIWLIGGVNYSHQDRPSETINTHTTSKVISSQFSIGAWYSYLGLETSLRKQLMQTKDNNYSPEWIHLIGRFGLECPQFWNTTPHLSFLIGQQFYKNTISTTNTNFIKNHTSNLLGFRLKLSFRSRLDFENTFLWGNHKDIDNLFLQTKVNYWLTPNLAIGGGYWQDGSQNRPNELKENNTALETHLKFIIK